MEEKQPTEEEYQGLIGDLRNTNTELKARLEALEKDTEITKKSLEDARALNTKMLLNNPVAEQSEDKGNSFENMTMEEIIESAVKDINMEYLKGMRKNAD